MQPTSTRRLFSHEPITTNYHITRALLSSTDSPHFLNNSIY